MSIEAGRYKAKIEDYGLKTVGEKNTPQLNIKFKVEETGEAVYFQNFLTEGTTNSDYFKNLMNTLVETGALRTKKFTEIAGGIKGGALATDVVLEIIVDQETDQSGNPQLDKSGNPYMKVQFINNPEKSGMKGMLAEQEAITVLGGLNLDAHILQAEQASGVSIASSPQSQPVAADDVPF